MWYNLVFCVQSALFRSEFLCGLSGFRGLFVWEMGDSMVRGSTLQWF